MARIERATSPLPRECSATELHGPQTVRATGAPDCYAAPLALFRFRGAGEGNRTLVVSLEGFCSAIELHPRFKSGIRAPLYPHILVEGVGFEPTKAEPTDLQSAPFDRSGTPPNETRYYSQFFR